MILILVSSFFVLCVSFLCSLCEAVLLSISSGFVEVAVEKKTRSGLLLKHIHEHPDRAISAILTVNTFSHTLGSAWIGYNVHKTFGETWMTASSVILTIFILIFSEILPKSVGKNNAKSLAFFAAISIQVMIVAFYPLVKISELISKSLSKPSEEPDITRDEMIKNADIAVEDGEIRAKESLIIKNLLKLDKIFVADVMTPRSVITALDAEMTVDEVAKKFKPIRFSRIPVYDDNLDNIIGLTHRYKVLEALSQDMHDKKLKDLIAPITQVSERMTVAQVLDYFIREKTHLSLVHDEYGVVTGLVTLEDAVETLLGVEIVDEFDSVEDMRKFALEQWQLRKRDSKRF